MTEDSFKKRAMIQETVMISKASLKDFNWQVKLVMSSDKLSNIKKPLVNLVLELDTEEGRTTKTLEMDQFELKTFIESLENANKSVQQLRS